MTCVDLACDLVGNLQVFILRRPGTIPEGGYFCHLSNSTPNWRQKPESAIWLNIQGGFNPPVSWWKAFAYS